MSSQDADTTSLLAHCAISDEQAREASLRLAGWARDAAELREWLQMTGLLPSPGKRRGKGGAR